MKDLKKFRNEIIAYSGIIAIIGELVSIIVIGPSLFFIAGLAVGTGLSILGFCLMVKTGELLVVMSKASPMVMGYIMRLTFYALALLICVRFGLECITGCALGLVTLHLGILALYGLVYPFIKKEKNPLKDWTDIKKWNDLSVYDDEDDKW